MLARVVTLAAMLSFPYHPAFSQTTKPVKPSQEPTARSAQAVPAITNADVLKMIKAGIGEQIVITAIQNAQSRRFDLSTDGLVSLKVGGVPDAVIAIMQEVILASSGPRPPIPAPTVAPTLAAVDSRPGPATQRILSGGTEIKLQLSTTLTSKDARAGQMVQLVVLDDVVVDEHVVIAKSAVAWGTITKAVSQRLVRSGSLELTINAVKAVNGSDVKLRGVYSAKAGRGLTFGSELMLEGNRRYCGALAAWH